FKQISYKNGEPLENNEFKEALLEFIFKNQDRIGKNLNIPLSVKKIEKVLSLEEKREIEKIEETKLFNENKDRFEIFIKSKKAFKKIS
ncbi:hypothetical protein DYV03_07945, partial [Campylobacter coli]|nr:hypothetical protein [Campylobacter coli]